MRAKMIFPLAILATIVVLMINQGCKKPPVPQIRSIEPEAVFPGEPFRIYGAYLTYFNELHVGQFTIESDQLVFDPDTLRMVRFPELPPGEYELYMTHDQGETERLPLTVLPPRPIITSIQPSSVMVGDTLSLNGQNIEDGTLELRIDNIPVSAEHILVASDSIIIFTWPASFAYRENTYPVRVGLQECFLAFDEDHCLSSPFLVQVLEPELPAPLISSITPLTTRVDSLLSIQGQFFVEDDTRVYFEPDLEAELVEFHSPESLTVRVPSGAQSGPIVVETEGGKRVASGSVVNMMPTLVQFSPQIGIPGDTITLEGWNFMPNPGVTFAESSAMVIPDTDKKLKAIVPALGPGKVTLHSTNNHGPSNTLEFTIQDSCTSIKPVLASAMPARGNPGDTVILEGSNIPAAESSVFFGEKQARVLTESGPEFKVIVPDLEGCGAVNVKAITPCGSSGIVSFKVEKHPRIDALSANSVLPGGSFRIEGKYFRESGLEIEAGNSPVEIRIISDSLLEVSLPESIASGETPLTLETTCGKTSTSITVLEPLPIISSLSAECGFGGDVIVVEGTKLEAEIEVFFQGQAVEIISRNATQMKISLPELPGNGYMEGTLDFLVEGQELEGSGRSVKWVERPKLDRFLPQGNPADAPLFLQGDGFQFVTEITFGGTATVRKQDGNFIYVEQFDEIALNVPRGLRTGKAEVCLKLEVEGCMLETCLQEAFVEHGGGVEGPTPSFGNPTVAIPTPPPGGSLSSISNLWSIGVYNPEEPSYIQTLFIDGFGGCSNPDELNTIYIAHASETELDSTGLFSANGESITMGYDDAGNWTTRYFGRQDYNEKYKPNVEWGNPKDCEGRLSYPLRIILTPIYGGSQLELIYPVVLDEITIKDNTDFTSFYATVKGRAFQYGVREPSSNGSYVQVIDLWISSTGENPEVLIEKDEITILEKTDGAMEIKVYNSENILQPGITYRIFATDPDGAPSNAVEFMLPE